MKVTVCKEHGIDRIIQCESRKKNKKGREQSWANGNSSEKSASASPEKTLSKRFQKLRVRNAYILRNRGRGPRFFTS